MSRFPEKGRPAEDVLAEVARERGRDVSFASGRILGSMCTAPHPVAREAYLRFLETNLGDPALFPGAHALEARALAALGDLVAAPPAALGAFVSGGSEGNFTALRIAARRAAGRREIVLPESAHFSFDKACDYLGLVPRHARVGPDFKVDVDDVRRLAGPRTAAIVALAGSTEHGVVDDVPALAEVARATGAALHVDAAYGGFVVPFLKRLGHALPDFDFSVEGVTTIALDPHKMGLAPIPSGVVFARDAADFRRVSTPSPYVSVERQPTLAGTRPGAAAAATWAVIEHLGVAGYTDVVKRAWETAEHLVRRLAERDLAIARAPETPIVVVPVADPVAVRARLRERGWYVNLAPLTRGVKIVCMPHVTREAVDAFVPDLADVVREVG
ncbi:MAG TPA: tyrosine decarboxylase MfnA [Candidatus Thermoplasmatota archaeon]|nr:tyrosine decarboxylase MfnA [Candidatus Thermoplasmatota archaeon]